MKRLDRMPTYIHMTMAFMGGLWGAYSVVQWTNLGNAHTTNLIKIVLRLIDGDWLRYAVIIVEAVSLAAVYFFPQNWPVYTRLYPCVFATAFQWSIFCGAQGFNCATIFNSNNYRQFSSSFAEVYLNKDPSFRPKMKFFGCTLLFYHFGVVYVYLILKAFSSYAIWSGLLPLVVAAVMIHLHRKELAVAKVE